jgi:mannitol-1-/sugar-/sorbitol-6-/2-deoxyglucose-6-phosphatase
MTLPIRAVIFDMDGVLIDTEPVWRKVEVEVFSGVGLEVREEQLLETMGVRIEQVVDLWYGRHPWTGASVEEISGRIQQGVIEHVKREGQAKEGVAEALSTTHEAGLPIAIASSSGENLIRTVVERLGIGQYVEVVASGENEVEGKPHPAVYQSAARRLGFLPGACLALEDAPNGVLSAKAAGMFCVAVPDPNFANDPRIAKADLQLSSLSQFTRDLLASLTESVTST